MTTTKQGDRPYGLARPTLDDVREALARVHLDDTARVWAGLLGRAGVRDRAEGSAAVDAVVEAMLRADPVTALIGRALFIRTSSYDHLVAAQDASEASS